MHALEPKTLASVPFSTSFRTTNYAGDILCVPTLIVECTSSKQTAFVAGTITIAIKKDRQRKNGRGRLTPHQSEDPTPTPPTHRRKEEKGKTAEVKKKREQLGEQKGIGPALETGQSHTIKYAVNQIIPERD